jgi:hypothetical protein
MFGGFYQVISIVIGLIFCGLGSMKLGFHSNKFFESDERLGQPRWPAWRNFWKEMLGADGHIVVGNPGELKIRVGVCEVIGGSCLIGGTLGVPILYHVTGLILFCFLVLCICAIYTHIVCDQNPQHALPAALLGLICWIAIRF